MVYLGITFLVMACLIVGVVWGSVSAEGGEVNE
jgi:hypothetical protein